jgi:two-component system chemotaxis response regulator CheY
MKPTILIVDDNEPLLRLLKAIFEKNFTVITAEDGVDAIYLLSRGIRPRLVLCDLQMRNIDGYELVAHLATSSLYRDIPVILLSETDHRDVRLNAPNVARLVRKPFDPLFLEEVVTQVFAAGGPAERKPHAPIHFTHTVKS